MLLNKTFYQGQSLTIGVLIAPTYPTANLQSSAIIIGEKKIISTVINQMLRFELSSEDTRNFITSKTVNLVIDDAYFGRREYPLGSLSFEKTKGQTIDGSIDEGYTVVFNATINEVAIAIDSIMYDYVKGDKGGMADLPAGVVIDPAYVHTDNNYTNADKAKVAGAIQTETDPTVPAWAKEPTKPTYTANEVGLGNVDNTSDANKPISDATQTSLNNKVDKVTGSSLVPDAEITANQIAVKKVTTLTTDGGQLTGFVDPIGVDVSYNGTTRKVTLTGDIRAAYKGIPMTEIIPSFVSGWQSEAHDNTDGGYFLYFNGTDFVWSTVSWDFKQLMIASVYRDGVNFCLRECHGLMDWQSHESNHNNIGTYLKSGADVAGFTLNSDVATNRRPTISQALVYDEDLPSILPQLTNGLYSRLFLDGANNANLENDKTDIVEYTAGNRFTYNLFTGGVWTKAIAANNQYAKVFLMAVPVTSDADCQKNRYIWIMPQTVNSTLTTIQNLTPANLSLGQISTALAEYVFVQEFIIRATASGWSIISTAKLTGNKRFQITTSGALATSHTSLLDKNAELTNQHLDTTTEKTTPIDADSFGLWDSVTSTFKRLSVANMLTWFRGLPHTFTQLISFNGGVKTDTLTKLNGSGNYVSEDGGTIWHITKWFTPTGTFSSNGTTVTTIGGQLDGTVIGAKIGTGTDRRIITAVANSNSCTVDSAFSQNYSAVSDWGVYSPINGIVNNYLDNLPFQGYSPIFYTNKKQPFFQQYYDRLVFGFKIADICNNNAFEAGSLMPIRLSSDSSIGWSSTTYALSNANGSARDAGIGRASAGLLQIYDGITTTALRDLKLRSVQVTDNTAAASIDKVGMIRYRADANNSYTEMCMQTGSNTYAWVIIKQNTW